MKVTIFGTGYVGLVTGTCLAEMGNDVVCVDVDKAKIEGLKNGRIPIYEPGLEPMVLRNHAGGRLDFTTDAVSAVAHGELIFIAVGTPPDEDGSADLRYVLAVARTIGENLGRYAVVVDKSTVPVGTADRVREAIASSLAARGASVDFDVVSNPEFLKEGDAVEDCMKPDRIVIGSSSERAINALRKLYKPFNRNHDRLVVMDARSAELTKYAANAMLATKISFMNELANVAERVGADIERVREGIGSDPRIGYHFIYPGTGYGGYTAELLGAVESVNARQKSRLFELMHQHFDGKLAGRTIGVWGLAFKPNTDDMREAPSRTLIEALWKAGAKVRAYDPEARGETARIYGERDDLVLCNSMYDALQGADALAIVTEWKAFRAPDFNRMRDALSAQVVFDGRNLYEPTAVEDAGLAYYGIGRGRSLRASP